MAPGNRKTPSDGYWDMKVRKRDGRLETFDQAKIFNAIFKSAQSVGVGEDLLAEEMASVVTLFLERDFSQSVLPVEEIQEMVERVLMETGHTEIARAIILFRERRKRIKDVIQVRNSDIETGMEEAVEVDGGDDASLSSWASISSWSKGRIVAALMTEAELPAEMAAEIASAVENRVFQSGLTRISSSLIRELVDNELFNRGLSGRLFRQSILGVPGYDVKRLVESDVEGRTPADVSARIAGAVLRQYSLREIYSPEEAEAHLRGDHRLEGLHCPSGFLSMDLEPTLLPVPFGAPDTTPEYLAACVRFLEKFVAIGVNVDITDTTLLAFATRGTPPDEFALQIMKILATAPVRGQTLVKTPKLRLTRNLSEMRLRMLKSVEIRGKAARRFLDGLLEAFMDAATAIGRELAVPVLHLELCGEVPPGDSLLSKAVVLEAAGRLTMGAVREEDHPMGAITPLVGGVVLELKELMQNGAPLPDETFLAEKRSCLAMAVAAMYSKCRFMKKMHLKNRGPRAAIRRFLGGDGEAVGPGHFRIIPAALLRLEKIERGLRERGEDDGRGYPACRLVETFHALTQEEGRKNGHAIKLAPPWGALEALGYKPGNRPLEEACRVALAWSRFMDLDPLPDDFKGEAADRIVFIRRVLEGLSERDHVS